MEEQTAKPLFRKRHPEVNVVIFLQEESLDGKGEASQLV